MTSEQEEALGRAMAKQARLEGHMPIGSRSNELTAAKRSKKRDSLKTFFKLNPDREISITELTRNVTVSNDTARRCCWEFVSEGWMSFRQTKDGFLFQTSSSM